MIDGREVFTEAVRVKMAADALAEVAGANPPGPLALLRLSAMLVEGRAALVLNMLDLMIYEEGGDKEPDDGPTDS